MKFMVFLVGLIALLSFDESWSSTINLPKTGQTKCYNSSVETPCIGTGQDGEMQAGVSWPNPRFMNLGLRMVGLSGLYSRVIHFCKAYNRSAYDASYLALAESEKISFITADETLYNSVKKDLNWVKWLGDN